MAEPAGTHQRALAMWISTTRNCVANSFGDGRDWKRISNRGVAGAVRELRARRRDATAAANRPDQTTRSASVTATESRPQILPRHVEQLTEFLLQAVRTCSTKVPELTSREVLDALSRVSIAIRASGLDASPLDSGS